MATATEGEFRLRQPNRRVEFLPAPSPDLPDCFVAIAGPKAQTLVAIHGISRNAAEVAARFADHPAFRDINVVAPLFERERFGKYQLLQARKAHKFASDRALFELLRRLETSAKIATEKLLLFGFSGGAQMAHRLAMLHPRRIDRLCVASAGWYLLPDPETPYPYGLGGGCPVAVSGDDFLDVPMTVLVGSRDTRIDASVRQDPLIVDRQGTNRLRRARVWVKLMNERAAARGKAPNATLQTLEHGSHDFGQCVREAGLLENVATALLA